MGWKSKASERENYYGVNNQGSRFKVVYYKDSVNVWIEFYDHIKEQVTIVKTRWSHIQNKDVIDIFYPSFCNIGYLGKTTSTNKDGTKKESYIRWSNMLKRCYDLKYHIKRPTYKDCEVCEEWKCFANFEKDYEELLKENNFPENMELHLDKDILFKGNKVYSKENCVLIPSELNNMFTKSNKKRGNLPIGVSCCKNNKTNPFQTQVSTGIKMPNNKTPYILFKRFPTVEQAFQYYKNQKQEVIKSVAMDYLERGFITEESRLFKALISYEVDITD